MSQAPSRPSPVLKALFPSAARRAVVESLFSGSTADASMSEIARRAGLTPRAVAVEVQRLEEAGLVEVRAVGPSHVVRPNSRAPATSALSDLVRVTRGKPAPRAGDRAVRRSLAAHGAPLLGEQPKVVFGLPETILRGLKAARNDATILRVLPVVIAKHAKELDWTDLAERARRMNLRAELGMLLDLTAEVANIPDLKARAEGLRDARRKRLRYYPFVEGAFERQLAAQRSPGAARRWHFLMNMTEDSFRETVRKHVPAEQVPAR
jgi:DNA-binding transcriptional ArsR family regulator